ncbi:MAG: NAD(P)H-dependent oxidoreductase [Candidatus Moranbacteria bacterium]|nr:NAD(P)H-dependent oxidoreductase [Candidatus Moranbacteria bacterium]
MQEKIKEALSWRYATKVFDSSKQVSEENLDAIIEAGRMAPTAYGLQPFKIIHIKSKEVREALQAVSYGQPQIVNAAELFLVAARTDVDADFITEYVERIAKTRGMDVAMLEDFKGMMIGDITSRSEEERIKWAGRQAYIALGMMLETASLLGVDTCPMEGFDSAKVDEVLGLRKENLVSLGYMAVGYRGEGDMFADFIKVRLPLETFVIEK